MQGEYLDHQKEVSFAYWFWNGALQNSSTLDGHLYQIFFLTQVPFVEGPSSPFSLEYDLSNHYIIMLFLKHGRQFVPLLTSAKINQYLKVHPNGHNEDDWYKANQNCHYNFSILHIFSISLILVWRYIHPTTHTMQVNPNLASQSI